MNKDEALPSMKYVVINAQRKRTRKQKGDEGIRKAKLEIKQAKGNTFPNIKNKNK